MRIHYHFIHWARAKSSRDRVPLSIVRLSPTLRLLEALQLQLQFILRSKVSLHQTAIEPETKRVVIGTQDDLARQDLEADGVNWLVPQEIGRAHV